jgi:diaminohydroxyphosphoribosylaminopyrimidine deaminase/5-amino-6-(5-phosphoribosylamino)uracil reductase
MDTHELFMQRCLRLAQNGAGYTAPNPMVGAVLVNDNTIIGEGFHKKYGTPHAEVVAFNNVKDQRLLENATIYVNLEPCSHYGKTPPCAELILSKGVKHVVVACQDPNPKVDGNGIKLLRNNGVNVTTGVLEKEAKELNRFFFNAHTKHRPYIILKWAQSNDGFIDHIRTETNNKPARLSTPDTARLVHKLRAEVQAVIVGTNTALLDNPKLNVRQWNGKQPIRIAIDRLRKIPQHFHLLDESIPTIVFTEIMSENKLNTEFVQIDFAQNVIENIVQILYQRQIHSLLVEGGTTLINGFLHANLWDEIRVETADVVLQQGVKAPTVPVTAQVQFTRWGENVLLIGTKSQD